MKKKLIVIIIVLILFITVSIIIGTKQEKEEYKLIELTGTELTNTIISSEKISITFALYNEYDINSKNFLEDLKKVVRQTQENIYFVNTSHTTFEFGEIMSAITSNEVETLSYYVYQDGKLVVSNTYKNFKSLYKDLNGKKYDTKIIKTSKKEKEKAIETATTLYNEGDIAGAYNNLSLAWDSEEAKSHYNNRPYYKLIGSWEIFEPDEEMIKTKYTNYIFLTYNNKLLIGSHEDKIDGFEKPSSDKYEIYDTKIKDDYIYTKKEKETKFKKTYKIQSVSKYKLVLISESNNKTYTFQYGY